MSLSGSSMKTGNDGIRTTSPRLCKSSRFPLWPISPPTNLTRNSSVAKSRVDLWASQVTATIGAFGAFDMCNAKRIDECKPRDKKGCSIIGVIASRGQLARAGGPRFSARFTVHTERRKEPSFGESTGSTPLVG